MSLRLPESLRRRQPEDPLSALFREEAETERVATLVRLNKALADAIARLKTSTARFHQADAQARDEARRRWRRRHAEAGEALWSVLIQREICGLRHHEAFLREFDVPRSVHLLMGPAATAIDPPDPLPPADAALPPNDRTQRPA
ncbi:hypothetical protein [Stappia indica]|uniref:hypothetical protein n=1 Tax=Stappia indica TaxID=538381 RepID=UPI001D191A5B|nr:hypothetical protein [Stappia indica]MCC4242904.1 hypothetical protein [Stappia indica]